LGGVGDEEIMKILDDVNNMRKNMATAPGT